MAVAFSVTTTVPRGTTTARNAVPSWKGLENAIGDPLQQTPPVSIDSVLERDQSVVFSDKRPTLFRERHGWCPYSERVWLALEHLNIPYDTVRIDNTGGPRPSYYSGQTPQVRWPDGKTQSESMDLVVAIDERYGNGSLLSNNNDVKELINGFRRTFPRNARPSSRAAFLFRGSGDPLFRSTFEATLEGTNDLLGKNQDGPFFFGKSFTAADIAWAPFLERYRYQLPCLHNGLDPYDEEKYPYLAAWYDAMDTSVPVYSCRVKGDSSSWRKVLQMAGFGNSFIPPDVDGNMDDVIRHEKDTALSVVNQQVWDEYASTRPYVAASPQAQAAMVILTNRDAILTDTMKRTDMWSTTAELDESMRMLVSTLLNNAADKSEGGIELDESHVEGVATLAAFLDERMCVPRDMGAMSAGCIKSIAVALGQ